MDPYLGEIKIIAESFAPRGWAFCNGQLLSIAQNTALFSLLGTTYGGNGQTNFALPNLQGRAAMGFNPSLYPLGMPVGTVTNTLLQTQLPTHNHILQANSDPGNTAAPQNNYFANTGDTDPEYANLAPNTLMSPAGVTATGGNLPVSTMQPYLGLNFVIALSGVFPSRS